MAFFAAASLVAGIGSSLLGNRHAKKMARKQERLAKEQSEQMRARAAEQSLASKQEIESLRVMRGLGLPAFKQASQQAYIQAQKGAERIARQRTMGRLAPDVRQAIFGGQFQQYVGREQQRLGLADRVPGRGGQAVAGGGRVAQLEADGRLHDGVPAGRLGLRGGEV